MTFTRVHGMRASELKSEEVKTPLFFFFPLSFLCAKYVIEIVTKS